MTSYVEFAAGEKRSWLISHGISFLPVVSWPERGDLRATGHGDSAGWDYPKTSDLWQFSSPQTTPAGSLATSSSHPEDTAKRRDSDQPFVKA